MALACPSSTWEMDEMRDCQIVEVPWILSISQKDTQRKIIQASQDTRRQQETGQHIGRRGGSTQAGVQKNQILET